MPEISALFNANILLLLSLAVIFYAYGLYYFIIWLVQCVLRKHDPTASRTLPLETLPNVSIVIASYNEADRLADKINNCLRLEYPANKIEILIGSDGSSDATRAALNQFSDPRIRVFFFERRRGKMAVINDLVRAAENEICVFTDVGELFDSDAILHLVRHYHDPAVGAVTGNHIYDSVGTGLATSTRIYWKMQRFSQQMESRVYSVCACDGTIYSCRRRLFPFPGNDTINDDVAVPVSIILSGHLIKFEPKAIARGKPASRFCSFFDQRARGQAGMYQILTRYWPMLLPTYPARSLIFISHAFMPVLVPWCLVIAAIASAHLVYSEDKLIYTWIFYGQVSFYLLALIGFAGEALRVRMGWLSAPFFFMLGNFASIIGCYVFLSGGQRCGWEKTD